MRVRETVRSRAAFVMSTDESDRCLVRSNVLDPTEKGASECHGDTQ